MVITTSTPSEIVDVDFIIGGAGVVGLCIARELLRRFPGKQIVILDEHVYLGEHSSGRNSGVMHAGIYYPTNSLKHILCLEGNEIWDELSSELGVSLIRCGKFIFSTSAEEDNDLAKVLARAKANNVPGITEATSAQLKKVSENVNAHSAIYSSRTGILDVSSALSALKYQVESKGVQVELGTKILSIGRDAALYYVETENFVARTSVFINCLGFNGPKLRKDLGLINIDSFTVKGNYLSTTQKLNFPTLYYPIPPKDLKGLGVHSTIDRERKIKFGPNTEDVEGIDYSPSPASVAEMTPLIRKYFRNIDPDQLFWDYAGCRSKITLEGVLHPDFWITESISGYFELLGIESPGLTAAPAIARRICGLIG